MNSTDISQPSVKADLKFYWILMQNLADADRSGDPHDISFALGELHDFTLHTDPSPVRRKAAGVLAARNYYAAHHTH